jgi:hypothetical protein
MVKKSKVVTLHPNGFWESTYGKMFRFEIRFENGDFGEYSSKFENPKYFVVGNECHYEVVYNGRYKKIKPAKPKEETIQEPKNYAIPFKEEVKPLELILAEKDLLLAQNKSKELDIESVKLGLMDAEEFKSKWKGK